MGGNLGVGLECEGVKVVVRGIGSAHVGPVQPFAQVHMPSWVQLPWTQLCSQSIMVTEDQHLVNTPEHEFIVSDLPDG